MGIKTIFGSVCLVMVIAGFLFFNHNAVTHQKVMISADYPVYDSLESLVDKADTIIKGKVIGYKYRDLNITQENQSEGEQLNPGGKKGTSVSPYTVFTVKIEKAYKGTVKEEDTIEMKIPGGNLFQLSCQSIKS